MFGSARERKLCLPVLLRLLRTSAVLGRCRYLPKIRKLLYVVVGAVRGRDDYKQLRILSAEFKME